MITANLGEIEHLPRADRSRRIDYATIVSVVPVAVALTACFKGKGNHAWWVLLSVAVPVVRLTTTGYRRRILHRLALLRACFQDIEAVPAHRLFQAVFRFVVLPAACVFLCTTNGLVTGDSRPVMLTAASLVTEGNGELSEFLPPRVDLNGTPVELPYFLRRTPSGIYSSYPSGMVVFALPVAALARTVGADLQEPRVHARLEKWTASWLAAVSLGLFFLLALHVSPPAPALVMTVLLGTGSCVITTLAQGLWQQGGIVFFMLIVLLIEFRTSGYPSIAGIVGQGIACSMMLACRLSSALFLLTFGIWVFWRWPRRAAALALVSCFFFAPWAWFYQSIYASPFGPSTQQLAGMNWSTSMADSLAGVLISPGRGLIVYQPWILLTVAALIPWNLGGRPDKPRLTVQGWQVFCLAFVILHLALIAGWRCWWGGACWGSRLAAEVVPLCGLLCLRPIVGAWGCTIGRRLLPALIIAAFLLHAPALYLGAEHWNYASRVDEHPERLWSWSRAPFLYAFEHSPTGAK